MLVNGGNDPGLKPQEVLTMKALGERIKILEDDRPWKEVVLKEHTELTATVRAMAETVERCTTHLRESMSGLEKKMIKFMKGKK